MKGFQSQTLYELLEVSVGATAPEIKAAHERLARLYAEEQVVLYGLVDPLRAAQLREKLSEAARVLCDDDARDRYDQSIGLPPRDLPPQPKKTVPSAPPRPSMPAVAATTVGWSSSFTYVTASAPAPLVSAPFSYSAPLVTAPAPVAPLVTAPMHAPMPVMTPPPAPVAVAEPEAPRPLQLQVEVPPPRHSPVPAPVIAAPAPPVEPTPPPEPVAVEPPPEPIRLIVQPPPLPTVIVEPEPVVEPAPQPPPEPEVPRLSDDDVQVSIVPVRTTSREYRAPEPKLKPYEVPPGVEFNGDLLKQVRLARAISLMQLSERTRISVKHLEAVEADRYDALPVGVYLRGILMSVARELGLDGLAVSKSYLAFVDAQRSKG